MGDRFSRGWDPLDAQCAVCGESFYRYQHHMNNPDMHAFRATPKPPSEPKANVHAQDGKSELK